MTDNSNNHSTESADDKDKNETRPRVFFNSITFQDGTTIELKDNAIVVFVGGNNAGKSRALKDLKEFLEKGNEIKGVAVSHVKCCREGDSSDIKAILKESPYYKEKNEGFTNFGNWKGKAPNWGGDHILTVAAQLWDRNSVEEWKGIEWLSLLFCNLIGTETRITGSDAVQSVDFEKEASDKPFHSLYEFPRLEENIRERFRQIFGEDEALAVDRNRGSIISLLEGKYVKPENEQYIERNFLKKTMSPLEEQGDGMRSAASILSQIVADLSPSMSVFLIDEPEAFLHQPQAYTLGKILTELRPEKAQLFIATHSLDIIMGLLDAAPKNLHIIYLRRDKNEQSVAALTKEDMKPIIEKPFLRNSGILSSLFYERVILCEGGADCLFYKSLLDAMGRSVSNTLFLDVGGKNGFKSIGGKLKKFGVSFSIIADFDILFEKLDGVVRAIAKDEGDEDKIETIRSTLFDAMSEEEKTECKKKGKGVFLNNPKDEMKWGKLRELCAEIGLWIVPVGELESCYEFESLSSRNPKKAKNPWLDKMNEFTKEQLRNDPELEEARKFISEVWNKDCGI